VVSKEAASGCALVEERTHALSILCKHERRRSRLVRPWLANEAGRKVQTAANGVSRAERWAEPLACAIAVELVSIVAVPAICTAQDTARVSVRS
jgi:hypothetical protein